jgi:hypothetical protein
MLDDSTILLFSKEVVERLIRQVAAENTQLSTYCKGCKCRSSLVVLKNITPLTVASPRYMVRMSVRLTPHLYPLGECRALMAYVVFLCPRCVVSIEACCPVRLQGICCGPWFNGCTRGTSLLRVELFSCSCEVSQL